MNTISSIMLERQGLTRTLNRLKNHRIIVVCAPAGYGKTVTIAQWLDKDFRAKAILSLDEYDNNLVSFCEQFCEALRMCQPQNKALLEIISHSSFQSAPDEFTIRAISALSGRKQAVLAIDNLHLIHDSTILQTLLIFIKRLPKKFSIILMSRYDLPLDLSELWIKGQAAHISAEQFLFTEKEIMALYKKRDNQITQQQASDIIQKTQGWALGINAFLLSDGQSTHKVYEYLDDFVESKIWEKWDDSIKDFMLRTSVASELTPSLCVALTGNINSGKLLKDLVRKGAFITELRAGVYRYHHLFQRFLLDRVGELGEEFIHSILDTEGHWHLSQDDFYNAIDCFIRCKNHDGIAKCFDMPEITKRNVLMVASLSPILKHPETQAAAKKHPRLLYLMIWFAYVEGNVDDMISFMDDYYARHSEIASNYPAFAHEIHYIKILDFRIPLNVALDEIQVPNDTSVFAIHHWKMSMHMPLLHRGIVDYSYAATVGVNEYMNNVIIPKTGWLYGEITYMLAETFMAGLLYEQGELEEAYEHSLKANAALKANNLPDSKYSTMSGLACILDALGETDKASVVIDSISQMIEERKAYHLNTNFSALVARRKFTQGDKGAAANWLDTQSFEEPTMRGIFVDFTTSRALISVGKYDAAIIRLSKIVEIASAFDRPLDIIEAKILLAIAYWKIKMKSQSQALDFLEEAVRVANPYGYVQMFVNDGAELAGMLHKLLNRAKQQKGDTDKLNSFIKLLYMKTRDSYSDELSNKAVVKSVKYTDKQKAIMRLLCEGKSYREITEVLNMKLTTLRSHLKLIYGKLEVTNMVDAVTKINAMKLLV